MVQMENRSLCAECGGRCCKNGGCDFSASDFPTITFEEMEKYIDKGLISIGCDIFLGENNRPEVFLFVRMRDLDQDAIDFFNPFPSPCSALQYNGCPFDFGHRPSGGRYYIPQKDLECYHLMDVSKSWRPYQDILRRLVIKHTGLTPEEKASERIEDVFYHFLQVGLFDERFDYYDAFFKRVSLVFFQEEFHRAFDRCRNEQKLNRMNPFLMKL